MPDDTQLSQEAAKGFLLAEYARFAEAFWRNETTGETRVNWFIGIVTAALAGLVAVVSKADAGSPARDHLKAIVLAGLAALLVFGIVTFARMISRNEKTDQYKYAIDSIRQKFQDYFNTDEILFQYHPTGGPWKKKDKPPKRKLGGLVHIVAAINAVVMAIGASLSLYPKIKNNLWVFFLPALVLLVSFGVQYGIASWVEKKAKLRLYKRDPTHAGGVVFRMTKGTAEYLVIHPYQEQTSQEKKDKATKKIDTSKWVLPKGKIDIGELHGDAALREVREETGVRARIICPLDLVEYKIKDERNKDQDVRVKFYLMEMILEGNSTEKAARKLSWCTLEDIEIKIKIKIKAIHDESKDILRWAEVCRNRIARPNSSPAGITDFLLGIQAERSRGKS